MRILVGVNLSDEALAAVEQVGLLYQPDEVVLVRDRRIPSSLVGCRASDQ